MTILQQRQTKIHTKRKNTSWKKFVKEIASWYPMMLYKNNDLITVYPDSPRHGGVLSVEEFEERRDALPCLEHVEGDVFENISLLFAKVPLPNIHHFKSSQNANFANIISNSKNPYLSFSVTGDCEDVLYSMSSKIHSKRVFNSMMTWVHSENIYESSCIIQSSQVFYSSCIEGSRDIWWSHDLIGCADCLGCTGLKNMSYCIDNKVYEKEEYLEKKQKYIMERMKNERLPFDLSKTVIKSNELENAMFAFNTHRGRNVLFSGHEDGLYDVSDAFMASGGKDYAGVCHAAGDSEYVYCSVLIRKGFDVYYSYFCEYCSFCFGCVGLKNKSYCIYNKQYTKEERHEKVQAIFLDMEAEGTLGDFFPASMCPFNFNDTAASLIEDFVEQEVVEDGYLRRDKEIAVDIPEWMEVVDIKDLGDYEGVVDGRRTIDSSILKKVIKDEEGNVYRVIKMEYDFLMKYGLPLPRKHWLKRLKDHFRSA